MKEKKLIQELEKIRKGLTQIYMALGNPENCRADIELYWEIKKLRKKYAI